MLHADIKEGRGVADIKEVRGVACRYKGGKGVLKIIWGRLQI